MVTAVALVTHLEAQDQLGQTPESLIFLHTSNRAIFLVGNAIYPCLSPSFPCAFYRGSLQWVCPRNSWAQFRASQRLQTPEAPKTSHSGSHVKTPEQFQSSQTNILPDPVVPKTNHVQTLTLSFDVPKDLTWLSIYFWGFLHVGKHYQFGPSATRSCNIATTCGAPVSESTHAMSPSFSVSLIQSFVICIWHLWM